jgi:hypothetical protein
LDELIQILEDGFVGRVKEGERSDTGARAEEVLASGQGEGAWFGEAEKQSTDRSSNMYIS